MVYQRKTAHMGIIAKYVVSEKQTKSIPIRCLLDSEKKWSQAKMHDKPPGVADTAREVWYKYDGEKQP